MTDATIEQLWGRVLPWISSDAAAGVKLTTTQVKLGVSALAEIVSALEAHGKVCGQCGDSLPDSEIRYLSGVESCGKCARAWWRGES